MYRIVYTVLFALCMGYCTFFSCVVENTFAAPQVIDRHVSVSSSGELAHYHSERVKNLKSILKESNTVAYSYTEKDGKEFQSDTVRSVYSSQYHAQRSFSISWSPLKLLDLSALWHQQRNKVQKKDLYDAGE